MKALRLTDIGRPLQTVDVPRPVSGDGVVLVRVTAAGICHSDVHYRDGVSAVKTIPMTPGHEIAGVIEGGPRDGERVCLHYLVTCRKCEYCRSDREQWCRSAEMLGKDRDGGYAEFISVPTQNAIPIPDNVPDVQASVMMCSSATSLHSLRKARFREGETVAVFGCGGLGLSAIQIARILGASEVYGVDLNPKKLELAASFGAIPVDARKADPATVLHDLTSGNGVDVVLELVGAEATVQQCIRSAGIHGRVALVGITNQDVAFNPYRQAIAREVEIVGVSDHHADEIHQILDWASAGRFDLSRIVATTVPLDADAVNGVLDQLHDSAAPARTVIRPA